MPPRSTSILEKEFAGMKTDVETEGNSVPSDAVASMLRPLIWSDGHTGRAVKTKKRDMQIAYSFPVSGAET